MNPNPTPQTPTVFLPTSPSSGHTACIYTLTLTATHLITTSRDHTICLWSRTDGSHHLTLTAHTASVLSSAASEPSDTLITADSTGLAISWRLSTGAILAQWQAHSAGVLGLALYDDTLATGSKDGQVKVWDAGRLGADDVSAGVPLLQQTWETSGAANAVVLADGGRRVYVGDGSGALGCWDTADGRKIMAYEPAPADDYWRRGGITALALSADERRVVTAEPWGVVRVYDVDASVAVARLVGHESLTRVVRMWPPSAFNGGVEQIVSGSYDGLVKVWREQARNEWVEVAVFDWREWLKGLQKGDSSTGTQYEPWVLSVAMDEKKVYCCGLSPYVVAWSLDYGGSA